MEFMATLTEIFPHFSGLPFMQGFAIMRADFTLRKKS
jgi:hypothetical protein